ncbi:carbohydrate-binding protein [Paenibacillus sp. B2(2019)]|uniref:carbohydrate-binding protein n=1 Tax=Paenibacillus sp. B2(2019) TaxID=2607754 RepID=UPI0021CFA4FA|nr:carbohydrate-binding protein [Paenibacillus sp. B2(2019)]
MDAGVWMDYKVNVATAGTYKVKYRVAVDSGYTGKVQLQVNGVNLKMPSFPTTGGLKKWVIVSDSVTLEEGEQKIRLYASQNEWKLNWLKLKLIPKVPEKF